MNYFTEFLYQVEQRGLKRRLRGIEPLSARECLFGNRKYLNFCSNNYLALADHPLVKSAMMEWTSRYGAGSAASRLVTGTFTPYLQVEEQVARWQRSPAALILGSGYLANVGIIPALADRHTAILADKLNHASLNAGCRLAGARLFRYRHRRPECPEHLRNQPRKLVVTDTVFSMDGDVVDLDAIKTFAESNNAMVYLDDAHATGIFGRDGAGLARGGGRLVVMGSFSKAMGSYGAYVACDAEIKDFLINQCASFIYTTALPPGVYGAIAAAVSLAETGELAAIRQRVITKSAFLNREIRRLGFDTGATASPIIPVIIGEPRDAVRVSQFLLNKGIMAVAIRPPTVPEHSARLRISVNAAHTQQDLELLLSALREARAALNLTAPGPGIKPPESEP